MWLRVNVDKMVLNPIYIYAPSYVDWSAGTRVLHQLCDQLNKRNIPAWIAIHGPKSQQDVSFNLNTPILSKRILELHFQKQLKTIAVYPETIQGNPLNANVTVSWILNSPQLLGGEGFLGTDFVYGFTKNLVEEYEKISNSKSNGSIFLPPIEVSEVVNISREEDLVDPFKLLYCQKFRALGGTPGNFEGKIIEVERFTPTAPSRIELLKLISKAEEVIVYENSTIITEAAIIGTPVRCISNQWFYSLLAEKELGNEGVVWGKNSPKADISKSKASTLNSIDIAFENLKHVLIVESAKWQSAATLKALKKTRLPRRSLISRHSLMRAHLVFKSHGLLGVIRFGYRYLYRWIKG